jgi:hypothetical protein
MQWDYKYYTVNVDMRFMQIAFSVGVEFLRTRRVHGAVILGLS